MTHAKAPRTTYCYRPDHSDLRTQQNIEKFCTTPLLEADRLDMNPSKKGPTFTTWMSDVQRHFLKTGLDSTVYVLKPLHEEAFDITNTATCTELFLFDEWGTVTLAQINSLMKRSRSALALLMNSIIGLPVTSLEALFALK